MENYQDKEVDDFVISLDETELDPHTEEYIGGFVSKKVYHYKFRVFMFLSQNIFSVDI